MAKTAVPEITAKTKDNRPIWEQELQNFIDDLFPNPNVKYAGFSFPVDAIDPLAYLEMNWQDHCFQYYWEKPSDSFAIAAGGALCECSASGPERFQQINTQMEAVKNATSFFSAVDHPLSEMLFLGGFSFSDHINGQQWSSFQPASLKVPKWSIIKEGKFHLLTIAVKLSHYDNPHHLCEYVSGKLEEVRQTVQLHHDVYPASINPKNIETKTPEIPEQSPLEYSRWISSVKQARKLIMEEKFHKIVLARQVSVSWESSLPPTQIINTLRNQYHNCYNFLVHQCQNETFLGSTPERLGSFRKRLLLTEALAGSMQRGQTATEDSYLAQHLAASPKNRNEHHFVVRDIEERLEDYSEAVNRSDRPEVKKLTNVQHLYTPIRARLAEHVDALHVVEQLHPTPAVGGYPREAAEPYIAELEHFERGWYAAPVGWLNGSGSGEFAVGIRSGLLTKNEGRFFAGCGIVADSDPAAEWEETNLKLKPMLSALQHD